MVASDPDRSRTLGSWLVDAGKALEKGQELAAFLDYAASAGLELYPAQEEAVLALAEGRNLILNTPTGSGKTLVAAFAQFQALARGERAVYTSPIKALVNEKFLWLCREFGAERVGMVTGDGAVNANAPLLVCTAEILAQDALRWGADVPYATAILDEFHYYSDRERGVAWQIPLLTLSKTRFVLMSATLGDTSLFERELTRLNGLPTELVRGATRPVPLEFRYSLDTVGEAVTRLIREDRAPVYLVYPSQRAAAEGAQNFLSTDFCSKEEKRAIVETLGGASFKSPFGPTLSRLLRHGVGLHHAGLLPRYRILVERLASAGRLKLICGTDTLGVGVNVPIRTVLLTQLTKFDGEKLGVYSVRDFHQITGRAGRKGFDDRGYVVAQAPEHVVENAKIDAKIASDPAKGKKLQKRKPPERFVGWDEKTFEKLIGSEPEALVSRFRMQPGLLLQALGRGDAGCAAVRGLIRDCHESDHRKKGLRREAFKHFRALVERGIVKLGAEAAPAKLKLNVDLQQDFSLHHALGLYLVDAIPALDPESPTYAVDLLTVVESILENPTTLLIAQRNRARSLRFAELKAEGMDFDERQAELEKVEYPKPNAEWIYTTFNAFVDAHPWVEQDGIRPKSVARELWEGYAGFADYVREYDLERSEGLLLRYLTEVTKTLAQSVPDAAKNEELRELETFLFALVRGVDSSLLEEWEKMAYGAASERADAVNPALAAKRAAEDWPRRLRAEAFGLVKLLARRQWEMLAAALGGADPRALEAAWRPGFEAGQALRLDPAARSKELCAITELPEGGWEVRQRLLWRGEAESDLVFVARRVAEDGLALTLP